MASELRMLNHLGNGRPDWRTHGSASASQSAWRPILRNTTLCKLLRLPCAEPDGNLTRNCLHILTFSMTIHVPFDNTYARLPERFFARVTPAVMPIPRLIRLNDTLARHLGLDHEWLASPEGVAVLAGKTIPEGAEPIALAYAGHQF